MSRPSAEQQARSFRRALLYKNLRTFTVGSVVVTLGFALAWWLLVYLPWHAEQDVRGAALHSATGRVTRRFLVPTGKRTVAPAIAVLLSVDGKTVQAKTNSLVRVGQTVDIEYRVGKSGIIYVERIAPL